MTGTELHMYVSSVKMDLYTSFHYFMNSFAPDLFISLNIAHPEYTNCSALQHHNLLFGTYRYVKGKVQALEKGYFPYYMATRSTQIHHGISKTLWRMPLGKLIRLEVSTPQCFTQVQFANFQPKVFFILHFSLIIHDGLYVTYL